MTQKKPKKPKTKKSLRSLDGQVENFGFSLEAINVMNRLMPKTSNKVLIRNFAKYLHGSESRAEFKFPPFADEIIGRLFESKIATRRVRSITFRLPGNLYTPDWNFTLEDGTHVNVEIKESTFQPSYRDSASKQRLAATIFWDEVFLEVMPDKSALNGWRVERRSPDPEYGELLQELHDILKLDMEDTDGQPA